MTTNSEKEEVGKFILSDSENIRTAMAVVESWPGVRDQVTREFVEKVKSQVCQAAKEALRDDVDDLEFYWNFGHKAHGTCLMMYRAAWWPDAQKDGEYGTRLGLVAESQGLRGWFATVIGPTTPDSASLQLAEDLKEALGWRAGPNGIWLTWKYLQEGKRDWDSMIPQLHEELSNGGEISDYCVREFVELATIALPIIDQFESTAVA